MQRKWRRHFSYSIGTFHPSMCLQAYPSDPWLKGKNDGQCVWKETPVLQFCVCYLAFFPLWNIYLLAENSASNFYTTLQQLLSSISEAVFRGEREKRPVDVETKFLTIIFSARATKKISGTDLNTKWLIRPHRKRPWVLLQTCLFVNRGQHQVKVNSWCYDSIRYRHTLRSDQWMVNSNVPNLKFMSFHCDRSSVQFAPWQKR